VVANGTRESSLVRPLLDEIRAAASHCAYIRADIGTPGGRARLLEGIRAEFGRVDVLINNAGVAPLERVDVLEMREESYDRVMAVNLKGPFFLTQEVAKIMIEMRRANPDLKPKIINISSISAYTSSPLRAEYCLSKAGLSMMTRVFADRLAEHGIGVFEIRPGIIRTPMTESVEGKYEALISGGLTPIRRWGDPEDVAKAVMAIMEDLFPFSTGEVFNVDGGFHLRRL
jgi:NAD(P)-dependent dehydrogenase (short-subunit alcohol dehydrogenase family)